LISTRADPTDRETDRSDRCADPTDRRPDPSGFEDDRSDRHPDPADRHDDRTDRSSDPSCRFRDPTDRRGDRTDRDGDRTDRSHDRSDRRSNRDDRASHRTRRCSHQTERIGKKEETHRQGHVFSKQRIKEDTITTINKTTRPALAALKLPTSTAALIAFGQGVVTGMTGNTVFPTPTPPLATVAASIAALVSAENNAATKVKGAATARNVAKSALILQLKQLGGYVQSIADGDVENSATIIESARISVRKVPVHPARVFNAEQGPTTGTAKLVAHSASSRAAYEWEYSIDAGKTWRPRPACRPRRRSPAFRRAHRSSSATAPSPRRARRTGAPRSRCS
jgi:hypothetical protein